MKTILEVVRDLIKPYIDTNASNIATVEDSTVENPYYVGDQLMYKGVLYNVTADISIGDTLEIGTNISVAPKLSNSIKSALNKLKSDGTSSGTDFNFDIQNGVPGWNSAANRDSSTFHPFSPGSTASDISYDNITSGLTATDVQAAIDEVDSEKLATYTNDASSWDTTPTANSTKPVTSGGVKAQFDAVTNEFTDVNNILGAKNILPNGASTVTTSGITFTVNANGTVKATGTATADASLVLASSFYVGNGRKVILSGCPSGGSTSKYFMYLTNENGNTSKGNDVGNGVTVTADANNLGCRIIVKKNQALGSTGVTFYPMVRPANIRNASYVPYAMTNRELSSQISNLVPVKEVNNQYSISLARNIISGQNIITFANSEFGNKPLMKIDNLTFALIKNLTNTNAYIKSMTLNYSSNPWQIVFEIVVDGNEYTKTIQLG